MATRSYQRTTSQARPIKFTTNFTSTPMGSVLVEFGETRVLCTASVEETIPGWMRAERTRGQGWLTAEYSLLPGSTPDRTRRERNNTSGRTQEIQRFIGRSLRSIVDMKCIGERTITIDCDVLQADGGTRTASVTGGYVALKLAIDKLIKAGKIKSNPIREVVAAVSVGIVDGQVMVDLDYSEDLRCDVDMNVVMQSNGTIVEIQGTAEKSSYTRQQLNQMVDAAHAALVDIFAEQNAACE
jgi:ribonuclease PH